MVTTTDNSGGASHTAAVTSPEPDWTSCSAAETNKDPDNATQIRSALLYGLLTCANQVAREHPKTAGKGRHLAFTVRQKAAHRLGKEVWRRAVGLGRLAASSGKCPAFMIVSLRNLLSDCDESRCQGGQ